MQPQKALLAGSKPPQSKSGDLGSPTNQQDMKLDWPNVEPGEERRG